jgi:pimeloyl-ACP methyl ester carboxylesterase
MTTSSRSPFERLERRTLRLPQGSIEYRETGAGPPVVLLHGLLVDGSLWRDVVPLLDPHFRVIVPELPLGCHRVPMEPGTRLAPPDVARLVADMLAALELTGVTLVGNDTGGAIAQLVAAHHPERIGGLVLTPCDAYENFLPPMFRPLQLLARAPRLFETTFRLTRIRALALSPLAFGWLMRRPDAELVAGWVEATLAGPAARRDAMKVLRGVSNRQTIEAAARLRSFDRPVLIAWAPDDHFFKLRYAQRLAAEIPGARLELIADALTFVPVDQPQRTADLIAGFARSSGAQAPVRSRRRKTPSATPAPSAPIASITTAAPARKD